MISRNYSLQVLSAAIALSLSSSPPAAASGGGSSVGGGGTVITLPDDTVVGTDQFVITVPDPTGDRIELGEPLKQELQRIAFLLPVQAGFQYRAPGFDEFLKGNVLHAETRYLLVDQLPEQCLHQVDQVGGLPSGALAESGACTKGKYTFLVRDKFNRMSLREKAKLLVHERQHDEPISREWKSEEIFNQVNAGIEVMLAQFDRQVKGERRTLTANELARLDRMTDLVRTHGLFRLGKSAPVAIHRISQGGGVYVLDNGQTTIELEMGEDAYVGIAASLSGKTRIGSRAVFAPLTGTRCQSCSLEADAIFQNSITNSQLTLEMAAGSQILQSRLYAAQIWGKRSLGVWQQSWSALRVKVGEAGQIENTTVEAQYRNGVESLRMHFASAVNLRDGKVHVHFSRVAHALKVGSTLVFVTGPYVAATIASLVTGKAQAELEHLEERYLDGRIQLSFSGDLKNLECGDLRTMQERIVFNGKCPY